MPVCAPESLAHCNTSCICRVAHYVTWRWLTRWLYSRCARPAHRDVYSVCTADHERYVPLFCERMADFLLEHVRGQHKVTVNPTPRRAACRKALARSQHDLSLHHCALKRSEIQPRRAWADYASMRSRQQLARIIVPCRTCTNELSAHAHCHHLLRSSSPRHHALTFSGRTASVSTRCRRV